MLRNADYIYDNVIIADEVNTTKQFCKKAQNGVDLSVKKLYEVGEGGKILKSKTVVADYKEVEPLVTETGETGWFLDKGNYICELNEGVQLGSNDVGYVIMRSSLNRNGITIHSALWDPEFTTRDGDVVNTMSVRMTVENPAPIFLEKDARVAQIIIAEGETPSEAYNGQFQGGRTTSKLQ